MENVNTVCPQSKQAVKTSLDFAPKSPQTLPAVSLGNSIFTKQRAASVMPNTSAKKQQIEPIFRVCCLPQAPGEAPSFHFHEIVGYQQLRPSKTDDYCTERGPHQRTYSPTDLCIECSRCAATNDFKRHFKIKRVITEHRANIEAELIKLGKGVKPLPHSVLERALNGETKQEALARKHKVSQSLNETQ